MSEELKPCPFCGGKAAFVPRVVNIAFQKDPRDPKFGVPVICGTCGAETANMIDEAHAAAQWNRRSDLASPAAKAVEMDASKLHKAIIEFDDFLNEPPEYEGQRMVRDYRHTAYRKWSELRAAIDAAMSAQGGKG